MPQDVAAALEQVVMNCGNMTKIEAAGFLKQLELKGRYLVEAWS
jgi:sulfite reductase alpha subunit-like flavoprotein